MVLKAVEVDGVGDDVEEESVDDEGVVRGGVEEEIEKEVDKTPEVEVVT